MSTANLAAALLVVLAVALGAAPARAETVNCTPITSLPAVITVQGVYCLKGDLSTAITSGNAIAIQTNNVTLDLNGFKLGGDAAGLGTQTFGIYPLDRQNITIKNGTVRGFYWGILLEGLGGGGHVVEDIRADQNTVVGIQVDGQGTVVRNNLIVKTGGTTTLGANANATGILVRGQFPRVLNNDVILTTSKGTGIARGIFFIDVAAAFAVNNRITGPGIGIDFGAGAENKFRDNLTNFIDTDYAGAVEDAGN